MKAPAEHQADYERILGWLDDIDRALDGHAEGATIHRGALALRDEAEDAWLEHRDTTLMRLTQKGGRLPGEEKLDALTRAGSDQARAVWNTYIHAKRLVRDLEGRRERLKDRLWGLKATLEQRPGAVSPPAHIGRRAA